MGCWEFFRRQPGRGFLHGRWWRYLADTTAAQRVESECYQQHLVSRPTARLGRRKCREGGNRVRSHLGNRRWWKGLVDSMERAEQGRSAPRHIRRRKTCLGHWYGPNLAHEGRRQALVEAGSACYKQGWPVFGFEFPFLVRRLDCWRNVLGPDSAYYEWRGELGITSFCSTRASRFDPSRYFCTVCQQLAGMGWVCRWHCVLNTK